MTLRYDGSGIPAVQVAARAFSEEARALWTVVMREHRGPTPPGPIVDVGCGTGRFYQEADVFVLRR